MLLINVAFYFLDYCFDKFGGIMLLQGLMLVNDVTHHFSVECHKMLHAFLNFKFIIMASIIVISQKDWYIVVYACLHGIGKVPKKALFDDILHCLPLELMPNAHAGIAS